MAEHADHSHDHDHSDGDHHHHVHGLGHVVPVKVLLGVFGALLVLTLVTVGVTHWDFGPGINLLIAMTIAATKATLVILFFMHLIYDNRLHAIVLMAALLFFTLFVGITLMDRGQYEHDVRWDQNTSLNPF